MMRYQTLSISISTLLLIALVSGCSRTPNASEPTVTANLVPFVHLNGITYLAVHTGEARPVHADALGTEFAYVQSMRADKKLDLKYRPSHGDAAYLPVGTPIFTLKAYDPRFRLAAWQDTQLVLFEADTNPAAQYGADLLDIAGKVTYLTINSPRDGTTELATITDQPRITRLVEMIGGAPVDQEASTRSDDRYFLVFYLRDGTRVSRAFWPKTGELSRGIMLPNEFSQTIRQAIAEQS
jgi:hypothetical protein